MSHFAGVGLSVASPKTEPVNVSSTQLFTPGDDDGRPATLNPVPGKRPKQMPDSEVKELGPKSVPERSAGTEAYENREAITTFGPV